MTKRITKPPSSSGLLAGLVKVVCNVNATDDTKAQAIQIAFEIGKSEGRVLGAEAMGNTLLASISKSTAAA